MIFFVKMKSKNFVKYSFENYDVESFIGKINFSTEKDIKVITHEEIIQEIIDNEVEINNFEPIICSVESTSDVLKNDNLSSCELVLLDGHHRFDYIKRKQIDNFIDVIIVSDSDVSINSHCSELLVSKNEFEKILVENNFIKDTQLPFFVSLDNCKYSNETINNIHELYSFKKNCLRNNIIEPLPNNQVISNEEIVNFTPITIKDIKNSKDLFPPKSTWITPRL